MRVYASLDEFPTAAFARGSAVAIGKFDGVHRGHRELLARTARRAAEQGLDPLAFTFANNPLSLLRPEICPKPIMSREQRLDALAAAGAAACVMVPFDAELAAVSAESFVEDVLVGRLRMRHLCVGADFRFGHRGAGDVELLRAMSERLGYTVEVLEDITDPDLGRVSSSSVREAIERGDVELAGRMMDRPVTVRGTVVHGDARGRDLGFPTANLGGDVEGLVPAEGVYAGWARVNGERHMAAISVGANVTFDPNGPLRVEPHLLDFAGDLYGAPIEVQFVQRLRGMVAFTSIDALVERIADDVRATREVLTGR